MKITHSEITMLQTLASPVVSTVAVYLTFRFGRDNLSKTICQMKFDRRQETEEKNRQVRREAYVELLATCEEVNEAAVVEGKEEDEISQKRRVTAETRMNLALAAVDIVAPIALARKAECSYKMALLERGDSQRDKYLDELANMMREDVKTPGVFRDDADPRMSEGAQN